MLWLAEKFSQCDGFVPVVPRTVGRRRVDEMKHCVRSSFQNTFSLVAVHSNDHESTVTIINTPIRDIRDYYTLCLKKCTDFETVGL